MKRPRSLFPALALVLLLAAPALAEDFSGRVVRILDGDTVEVLHGGAPERVRLAEIDCPEKAQAFGKKAKQFTADLAASQEVLVHAKGKDRYGRTIGEIILPDGRSLNRELVKAGLAWWYRQYSKDETLGALENEARAAKRGLWADLDSAAPPVPPWEWRKARRGKK